MPAYDNPDTYFPIDLPSSDPRDPFRIVGPGELSYWDETRIMSKTQHMRQLPDGTQEAEVDNAMFEYLLVHTWLEHPSTTWNLYRPEAQGGGLQERDTATIDRLFRGAKGRRDRAHIASMLAEQFFPDMIPQNLQAPEGNGDAASSTETTPTPAPADFLSKLEAGPNSETFGATGSTPSPEERPAVATPSVVR